MRSKSPAKPLTAKRPSFNLEQSGVICGCDEAGRGPLAGPVTAACVFIPHEKRSYKIWEKVRDSKLLSPKERENIFDDLREKSCFGIASASVEEIDEINILQAAILAMKRATENMCQNFDICPDLALIDGNYKPQQFPYPTQPVIKGDMLSVSIAAASILAKVTRDRIMKELHDTHPHYGWLSNAGYATPVHLHALRQYGPCAHHRRKFSKVKELLCA
ncbi:MAG: ribonuclease HII [Micavibrio aeruginosavorus]|uniref:Ribonuclease HII n=1 Tax=Micavibrio aeruginosavorus TaxID=349221 RepID=A0A2W5FKJ5_9BACT|nr:MAG: ribonuclease HII [Micavibrio aeruginosavorus]